MTVLEVYENVLVELNKVEAPSLLLSDFNYFLMKGIYQKINKDYGFYGMNQLLTDSLSPFTKTVSLTTSEGSTSLPEDYLHLLECSVFTKVNSSRCEGFKNYSSGAIRLPSDARGQLESNYYMRPSFKRPYYYIQSPDRTPVINIVYGNDPTVELVGIRVQYLSKPIIMSLTEEQIDMIEESQEMQFADYVCYEVINDIVKLILENASDPRLQSHIPINQTILPPMPSGGGGK